MDAIAPRVQVIRRQCVPKFHPCPHCGHKGRRFTTHTRRVRDIAYHEIRVIELKAGEYRARCSRCKTFRAQVEGIEPRAEYTNRVRDAVIDRLLDDRMSMNQLQAALARDFHLDLSDGFLYDCLEALGMLTPEKFEKMIAYLHSPAAKQVRTNNHVERTNRTLRSFEKVRYKWRRRRTIVRFVVLAFDRWRKARINPKPSKISTNKASSTYRLSKQPRKTVVFSEKSPFFSAFRPWLVHAIRLSIELLRIFPMSYFHVFAIGNFI
jgi:hypothetical protein